MENDSPTVVDFSGVGVEGLKPDRPGDDLPCSDPLLHGGRQKGSHGIQIVSRDVHRCRAKRPLRLFEVQSARLGRAPQRLDVGDVRFWHRVHRLQTAYEFGSIHDLNRRTTGFIR